MTDEDKRFWAAVFICAGDEAIGHHIWNRCSTW